MRAGTISAAAGGRFPWARCLTMAATRDRGSTVIATAPLRPGTGDAGAEQQHLGMVGANESAGAQMGDGDRKPIIGHGAGKETPDYVRIHARFNVPLDDQEEQNGQSGNDSSDYQLSASTDK